jgi:nucleotide-binding universal stress UspA family protein
MVRRGSRDGDVSALRWRRILVPATGTRTGRAALEVACAVARESDAEVVVAHVVTSPDEADRLPEPRTGDSETDDDARIPRAADSTDLRLEMAERVLAEARSLAAEFGVRIRSEVRRARAAPEALLALATEHDVDLVVLGANVRQLSGRPFLGHGVEYLLARSASTVIVVTAPAGRTL